jgi:tight adherence protein B
MGSSLLALAVVMVAGVLALGYARGERLRRLSLQRAGIATAEVLAAGDDYAGTAVRIRAYPPRYRFAGPAAGLLVASAVFWGTSLPGQYAGAFGLQVGVIVHLLEAHWAGSRRQKIEAQLADAIDLMVAAVRSGSALLSAFEAAMRGSQMPLRGELEAIIGRIRIGEDPRNAVRDVAERVPLESFRLFAHCLLVHWETGGSLAPSLRSVGKTIRDRLEVSRRISAQAVEAQVSVVAVMAIAYGLTVLRLYAAPEQTTKLIYSRVGAYVGGGGSLLQTIGIAWIWRMSRIRF